MWDVLDFLADKFWWIVLAIAIGSCYIALQSDYDSGLPSHDAYEKFENEPNYP